VRSPAVEALGAAANQRKATARWGGETAVARALAVGGGPEGEAGGECERGDVGDEVMFEKPSGPLLGLIVMSH
jgi:hypothetical protein